MDKPSENPALNSSLQPSRHAPRPSVDTNASGIAESTISFSQFPHPPSSIPPTPIRSEFSGTPSPSQSTFPSPVRPLVPRKGLAPARTQATQNDASAKVNPLSQSGEGSVHSQATKPPRPPPHRVPPPRSPYDWPNGASNIDEDAAEDRLLPTSFITSLLQENKDLRRAHRSSYASDAFSGISEMTYPPPAPPLYQREDPSRSTGHHYGKPPRPQGGRAPPSSFAPIPESDNRMSSDSETLHSTQGHPSMLRRVSVTQGVKVPSASVVGVASATLQSIASSSRPPSSQTVPMSVDEKGVGYGLTGHDMDDDSILQYKANNHPEYSPQQPTPNTPRRVKKPLQPSAEARASVHSFKSVAPSFISRMSMPQSLRRAFNWRKTKPLPRVPMIPHIPVAVENQQRKVEENTPLPDLVSRAGALHTLLEKGYHPHQSLSTYQEIPRSSEAQTLTYQQGSDYQQTTMMSGTDSPLKPQYYNDFGARSSSYAPNSGFRPNQPKSNKRSCMPRITKRVYVMIAILMTAVVAAVIAVAVVVSKRNQSSSRKCPAGLAGSLCNLNSTCVCTSTSRCNGLAQNIVDLIPVVNEAFFENFTASSVYNSLWYTQGSTSQNNCSPHSLLVDTGKALNDNVAPNRTHWAQAALLWNVVRSQDLQSASKMQRFVQNAPWSALGADGPATDPNNKFTSTFSGYTYNFAAQTVIQPPVTFISEGQPTNAQIARVGSKAQAALNQVYTYAKASSTQSEAALKNYWTTTLSQRGDDLPAFKALLSVSPILMPFNATSTSIQALYSNSSTSLFPPALACYPGLNAQQLGQVRALETSVFNLEVASSASSFDATCYSDHPVYGVLDILRLRLPFIDSRTGLPRQAAILNKEATPRAVVYVNEMLSATFPGTPSTSDFSKSQLDPRRFGTLNLPNHILLQYLSSMPVDTATTLVEFVLSLASKPPVPPGNSSSLLTTLSSIPVLEVAIFGNIGPTDVSGTVASFSASSDSLFFGSDSGSAFRSWVITTYGGNVLWAETAVSPQIVKDNSLSDATVDATWRAIATAIRTNAPNIGLANITATFRTTQKFTPT